MPTFQEIVNEIQGSQPEPTSDIVRKKYVNGLFELTQRNVILYYSAWQQNRDCGQMASINDFDMNGFMSVVHGLDRSKGVDLILHTPGGDLSATEAIGEYIKRMFGNDIRVIVPHLAMSGGTLISFLAKEILMGTHSSLGPIDPIFGGTPAHGVIDEFNRAIEDVTKNPSTIEVWKHIIAKYPVTFIGSCQNAIEWTDEIATRWLREGMFSNDSPDNDVTIKGIVEEFGDRSKTKFHGRHFTAEQCKNFGLRISRLEDDQKLQDAVLSVHHACIYALGNPHIVKMIENHLGQMYATAISKS